MIGATLRKGEYFDSVFLMRMADRIGREPGVSQVAAVMGTPANKELLAEAGFTDERVDQAGPNDLVVAVRAEERAVIDDVLSRLDAWLAAEAGPAASDRPRTLEQALAALPDANLAVVSLPGEHAAREARRALDRGLHVFLFSDNVAIADELALKRVAAERGLLVMGPDCGTAIVAGKGIGFANAVRRGPVGIVGASGTGMQEVATLVHRAGSGVSHAIGTGSHDPSDEIGGVSTLAGLEALDADAATRAIVLVSKPPGERTLSRLAERAASARKPVVACFLGREVERTGTPWQPARTLDDAAGAALRAVDASAKVGDEDDSGAVDEARARLRPEQRYARGLFAGGSLCYQAQDIFRQRGLRVRSNAPLEGVRPLADARRGEENALVDLGADEFTRGRPHPMIDPRLRRERILAEGDDPAVAVLLLDVILGYGCAPDPAGVLADAIADARRAAERRGGGLAVVASVVGTEDDPQDLERQTRALRDAGAIVSASSAAAARLAAAIVSPG